ncbi:MAG: response regulator [Treponema sp.]|nr:response regulator [Treponema sp.]
MIVREPMPYGRVLLVDDMQSNLDVARLLLGKYQLQIDTAESGFEAIEIIKNGKVYDIVFLDQMMPGMDGLETTKNLRELGYTHPIFALTADAEEGQADMFLERGFDGFLSKPIDLRQLNEALCIHIRDKKGGRHEEAALPPDAAPEASAEEAKLDIQIPGLNAKEGLALYGGDREVYLSVLRSFVPNAVSVIEKIRDVSKENLSDYIINVHGLKGISAGIGAEKLKDAAFDLEKKARAGELPGVLAANGALLEDAKNLVSYIQNWLGELDRANPKPALKRPSPILLARLRKSCEAYDMSDIDEVMDELEGADYYTDASLITWLREKIDCSDFSDVVSRLSEYAEVQE